MNEAADRQHNLMRPKGLRIRTKCLDSFETYYPWELIYLIIDRYGFKTESMLISSHSCSILKGIHFIIFTCSNAIP